MNDDTGVSRLDALRFARRVVAQQTVRQPALIDRWITDEERREAEHQRGQALRPAAADWLIQHGLNRTNRDAVHTGDCRAAARSGRCRPATREEAHDELRQRVPACVHCRPDTALGLHG